MESTATRRDPEQIIYQAESYLSCGTMVYPRSWHGEGIDDKIERDMDRLSKIGRPPELRMLRPGKVDGLAQMVDAPTYGSSALKPPVNYSSVPKISSPPLPKYSREYIDNQRMLENGWCVAKELSWNTAKLGVAVVAVYFLLAMAGEEIINIFEAINK